MQFKILATLIFMVVAPKLGAQSLETADSTKNWELGGSVQIYPAGIIAGMNAAYYHREFSSISFRLGVNITDRRDFSPVNDEERGEGLGGSLGYHLNFPSGPGYFVAGFNSDFWNLWIRWRDNSAAAGATEGKSYVLVWQPWVEGGYYLGLGSSRSKIGLTVGFGREINVITSGEEVAQDWIASALVHYRYTLGR